MKTKSVIKRFFHWLSKRSAWLVTSLLFVIAILMFWFYSAGFSPNAERTIIGIAATTAFLSAVSAISALFQAVEVQRQRENLERPYVTAYFDGASSGALFWVIENSGNSPALDVSFKFEPAPIDFAGRPLNEISLFKNPITFLPAGKVIRQIIDAGYRFLENGKPTKYKVTVKYSSVFSDYFSETIEHDLEYLKQVTLPRKTTEDYLKKMSEELSELTRLIKKAQGSNSFLVETPDEYTSRMDFSHNDHIELNGTKRVLRSILTWILFKLNGN